jgi:hypothetical protein
MRESFAFSTVLVFSLALAITACGTGTTPVAVDMSVTVVPSKPRSFGLSAGDGELPTNRVECQIVSWPTNGTLAYAYPTQYPTNSRYVVYTFTHGTSGGDSFTFRASDGTLTSSVATCTITVTTNSTPVAQYTAATVTRGLAANIPLNASQKHADAASLACTIVTPPSYGAVTNRYPAQYPTNSIWVTYLTTNGAVGDSFTFCVSDGSLQSTPAQCVLTITTNTPPYASSGSATVITGTTTDIWLPVSDTAPAPDQLRCVITSNPSHGTVAWKYPAEYPTNSYWVRYTPDDGFVGTDSFAYAASDGFLSSGIATCTVFVVSNTAPTAFAGSWTVASGTPYRGIYLSGSDAQTPRDLEFIIVSPPTNGVLAYQWPDLYPTNSRAMLYTSNKSYTGPDTFTYRTFDGSLYSSLATGTITVIANTGAVASATSASAISGKPVSIRLNAWDLFVGSDSLVVRVTTAPSHGRTEPTYPSEYPQRSCYVTYTSDPGFVGTDRFAFVANDWDLDSIVATCTVTVVSNSLPVVSGARKIVAPDSSLTWSIFYSHADSSQTLTPSIVDAPSHGTADAPSFYSLRYTPTPGYHGPDSFTFKMNDGEGDSNIGLVRILVRAADDRAGELVALVVNATLAPNITNEINRLRMDLQNEGYSTTQTNWPTGTSASNLWGYLQGQYSNTNQWLAGAILVGSLPKPQTWANHTWSGLKWHYTDLVYWNMSAFQTNGAVAASDIWVSRLSADDLTYGTEIAMIQRALQANHDYRTGASRLPRMAYNYHGSDWSGWASSSPRLLETWPDYRYAEGGSATNHFITHPDLSIEGADAFAGGADVYDEVSHGSSVLYMNGAFVKDALFRVIAQIRACLITSCSSGAFGGIVNDHLFTRNGGCVMAIGATDTCLGDAFVIEYASSAQATFRSLLKQGETWGGAAVQSFPYAERTLMVTYGDLSLPAMATPSNALPQITSFRASKTICAPGEPVTFNIAVNDPDAAATNSPFTTNKFEVEWFMNGYNAGRQSPTYTNVAPYATYLTDTNWLKQTHAFSTSGTYTVRVEVMDQWKARYWREMQVTCNQSPVASNDTATVEANHDATVSVLANDFDPDGQAISIQAYNQGGHGAVAQSGNSLVYTPTTNWTGIDSFAYTIRDTLGAAGSATVTVTVVSDVTPPAPVSATSQGNPNQVSLLFNEKVLAGSSVNGAENPANYGIDYGVIVSAAVRQGDRKTVKLTTTALTTNVTYTLTVNHVADIAVPSNAMTSAAHVTFQYVDGPPIDTTDDHLGTVTARGENLASGEVRSNAFDNSVTTKWLDFSPTSWIQYQYVSNRHYIVVSYTIASANDSQGRDPKDWTLKGSNDGGTNWVTVDSRSGESWSGRHITNTYTVASPGSYNVYRLNITANYGGVALIQLAEIELLGYLDNTPAVTAKRTPVAWLMVHVGTTNNYDAMELEDPDGDGSATWEEYQAGTEPLNGGSVFEILSVRYLGTSNELRWYGTTNSGVLKPFAVDGRTNLLLGNWNRIGSNLTRCATGTNLWIHTNAPATSTLLYRIVIPQ